jgi:hypothetical protein
MLMTVVAIYILFFVVSLSVLLTEDVINEGANVVRLGQGRDAE